MIDIYYYMPEGFCHHARYGLYKKVSILQCGGGFPDWAGEKLIKFMEFNG